MPRRHRLTLLPLALSALACGENPPPPPVVAPAAPTQQPIDTGPTSVESAIGGMNQDAVERGFKNLQKPIEACLGDGSSRIETMGGHFLVSLRVDREGGVKWAYMKETTLGDRETERCILGVVKGHTWPRPLSGDGLVEKAFDIDPGIVPTQVDERKIKGLLTTIQKKLFKCRVGVKGSFQVTVYLTPWGRARGAGVQPPSELGEAAADCMATEVVKFKYLSTGKQAKLTFTL